MDSGRGSQLLHNGTVSGLPRSPSGIRGGCTRYGFEVSRRSALGSTPIYSHSYINELPVGDFYHRGRAASSSCWRRRSAGRSR